MSADAKAYRDDAGWWRASHDGCDKIHGDTTSLSGCLEEVELCAGVDYGWEFQAYPDGSMGLVGYTHHGGKIEEASWEYDGQCGFSDGKWYKGKWFRVLKFRANAVEATP